jgi:hypothetical protein
MSGSVSRADIDRLVGRLAATPGRASYDAVRDAVVEVPGLVREVVPTELARLLDGDDPATAVRGLEPLMPGALLSPAAHAALASALDRVGRREDAATHRSLARSALRGMLGSGRGTRDRPWRVLRVSDEYDVLRYLGRRPRGQDLVEEDGVELDRIATDGDDAWFRLVAPLPAGSA